MRAMLIVATGAALSFPAMAQPQLETEQVPCGPYDELAEQLTDQYAERPTARGLDSKGMLMELWASEETGTWTALLVRPDGIACMARIGEAWGSLEVAEAPGEVS